MMPRFLPALMLPAALLTLTACGAPTEPAPDPRALEEFVRRLEAQDRAARAEAVAEARRKEQQRIEAAERRLARYRDSA